METVRSSLLKKATNASDRREVKRFKPVPASSHKRVVRGTLGGQLLKKILSLLKTPSEVVMWGGNPGRYFRP